jgi:glycosyltransferase involved in cell wall biosynthesis
VDLPKWLRFWKRGRRGIHFYYLLWQIMAFRVALVRHRESPFTVAWHLTLANAWIGSLLCLLPVRSFIYGPVAGGLSPPWRLVGTCGSKGCVYEVVRAIMRAFSRVANPLARLSWRRAHFILVQNSETRDWLPHRCNTKTLVFPNTVAPPSSHVQMALRRRMTPASRTAVYAGNLLPLKGVALAIGAIAANPGWKLKICGTGWDEARLKSIARRRGVVDRVHFLGRQPHSEIMRIFQEEADVLLFPSLHEEGGWAVMEAMMAGVPVVAFRRGGPGVLLADINATTVDPGHLNRSRAERALSDKLDKSLLVHPDVVERALAPFRYANRVLELRRLVASSRSARSGA